ncbi:protein eva-1 homolog C isoform X2 [Hypomesus transpacificus]|uniref:protein eva-1 homolog C isoform X2 n=1 Tax=Hypomesus transpacificus TaxID=137520 RepID=UPI001F073E52|nr:protein eva-1 homolog C isoform X2 [Hypomesus transpacificus]
MTSDSGNASHCWSISHELMWSPVYFLYISVLLWTKRVDGLADFSNYLSRIITSHSTHACEGHAVRLFCPRHSTISIQSAFYGRGDSDFCSSDPREGADAVAANHNCSTLTALQKVLSECEGFRSCQLPVNHQVFGRDPCPEIPKYLSITYMCKPKHKSLVVCEEGRLLLRCKPPKVLLVYAAIFGRGRGQQDTCPTHPTEPSPFDCLNHEAVHAVSRACHNTQRCEMAVNNQTFRDPCFPGTRKYLMVLYSCVPQTLVRETDPDIIRITSPSGAGIQESSPSDLSTYPKGSRRPDNSAVMMSNSLMTYGYIKEHPETAALLFTSSVCVGLLLTLLAVSARVSCRGRSCRDQKHKVKTPSQTHSSEEEDETDCSLLSDSDRKPMYCWEEVAYTTEAAEQLERIERRELVIQEIWMNAYLNGTAI